MTKCAYPPSPPYGISVMLDVMKGNSLKSPRTSRINGITLGN